MSYIAKKSRPVEGSISWGTLRQQDLLRAFADEIEAHMPFNGARMCSEAREIADTLDSVDLPDTEISEQAAQMLESMTDQLNEIAAPHGLYFGTCEGDGSDFGFWRTDCDDWQEDE